MATIPLLSNALEQSRQRFLRQWMTAGQTTPTPYPELFRLVHTLGDFRCVLRRSVRRPITFANIDARTRTIHAVFALFYGISFAVRATNNTQVLRLREMLAIRRLERALEAAIDYPVRPQRSAFIRECLERDLSALFASSLPPSGSPVYVSGDVLCVLDPRLFSRDSFGDYVEACAVIPLSPERSPEDMVVVRIPRWVYDLLAAMRPEGSSPCSCTSVGKVVSFPKPSASDSSAYRVYMSAATASISSWSEIPSPEILAAALALWSPDRNDLYHDLNTAIAAAQCLR